MSIDHDEHQAVDLAESKLQCAIALINQPVEFGSIEVYVIAVIGQSSLEPLRLESDRQPRITFRDS
jgi:hypothetical protein